MKGKETHINIQKKTSETDVHVHKKGEVEEIN